MHRSLRLACLFAVFAAAPAWAWGPLGHRVVAELAGQQLSPAARAEVERLLAPEHARTLVDVAIWADDLRDDPAQRALAERTRRLHYVNFRSADCVYLPPRDCRDGQCVVAAIGRYAALLADRSRPDAERREALKFVVHFVADVHQPLHAGYRDDKGGNDYQVRYGGQGTNLHAVWDSLLLDSRGLRWRAYAAALDDDGPVSLPPPSPPLDDPPAQWAQESCRIVRDDGVYPRGHAIGAAYVAAERPLAERRLREAGVRLAALLNRALAR